jgi:hypothetical protein
MWNEKDIQVYSFCCADKGRDRWWLQNVSSDDVHNHASNMLCYYGWHYEERDVCKSIKASRNQGAYAFRDVITVYDERYGEV